MVGTAGHNIGTSIGCPMGVSPAASQWKSAGFLCVLMFMPTATINLKTAVASRDAIGETSLSMARRTWQAGIVYTLAACGVHLASGPPSLFVAGRNRSRGRSVAVLVGARLGSANAVRASELAAERPRLRRQHLLPRAQHARLLRSSAAAGAGPLAGLRPHSRCRLLLQRLADRLARRLGARDAPARPHARTTASGRRTWPD